jgi:hypothetical protein
MGAQINIFGVTLTAPRQVATTTPAAGVCARTRDLVVTFRDSLAVTGKPI